MALIGDPNVALYSSVDSIAPGMAKGTHRTGTCWHANFISLANLKVACLCTTAGNESDKTSREPVVITRHRYSSCLSLVRVFLITALCVVMLAHYNKVTFRVKYKHRDD